MEQVGWCAGAIFTVDKPESPERIVRDNFDSEYNEEFEEGLKSVTH